MSAIKTRPKTRPKRRPILKVELTWSGSDAKGYEIEVRANGGKLKTVTEVSDVTKILEELEASAFAPAGTPEETYPF